MTRISILDIPSEKRSGIERRFWSKVDKAIGGDGCWIWRGTMGAYGYGHFYVTTNQRAHRVAYELTKGKIPIGLELDHLCRNRACVNPDHLEPVTRRVNWMRGKTPSRIANLKDYCPKGHPLFGENLAIWKSGQSTRRACLTCYRERARLYARKNRLAHPERVKENQRRWREKNRLKNQGSPEKGGKEG